MERDLRLREEPGGCSLVVTTVTLGLGGEGGTTLSSEGNNVEKFGRQGEGGSGGRTGGLEKPEAINVGPGSSGRRMDGGGLGEGTLRSESRDLRFPSMEGRGGSTGTSSKVSFLS